MKAFEYSSSELRRKILITIVVHFVLLTIVVHFVLLIYQISKQISLPGAPPPPNRKVPRHRFRRWIGHTNSSRHWTIGSTNFIQHLLMLASRAEHFVPPLSPILLSHFAKRLDLV
jgi:hypothetical protein